MSRDEKENISNQQQQQRTKVVSLSSATRPAGQFKCVGAIRKAGFLSVKKWILKRKQSIELARKQGWKRYWVCLRGTTLLFYSVVDRKELTAEDASNRTCLLEWIQSNCANQQHSEHLAGSTSKESLSQCYIEKEPRHLIIIEGSIAQPIPEHPKRDFVFCLSTTFGDAYLFQSACQLESDNWIAAIHNACAASIARDLTRDEATRLFENKIRHLEIEVDKKLFLRQRLESRLTTLSSMSHIVLDQKTMASEYKRVEEKILGQNQEQVDDDDDDRRMNTMRSLLIRLNQQLMALDTYIEQVHCEIYQLRCYISSCSSQKLFYQQWMQQQQQQQTGPDMMPAKQANMQVATDLPHPKALLMHVSKPTKMILINLGIFTVSSFHAYIHARQGSAQSILQRIQRQTSGEQSPTVELRVRSRSLSEQMLSNRLLDNVKLENETEKLIVISNLKQITVKLSKTLYEKIKFAAKKRPENRCQTKVIAMSNDDDDDEKEKKKKLEEDEDRLSDDRYSIHEDGESHILVNMRIHPSSTTLNIIKQLLNSIEPNLPEMDFLNYYLQFDVGIPLDQTKESDPERDEEATTREDGHGFMAVRRDIYVVKRTETPNDWSSNMSTLELVEKIVFRLDLTRRQIEEEASPFGISIGVQLFEGKIESLLSVHCSYIEWGSVADRAGLKDDDELLMINGVPVMDLDMMFVESLIQDDTKLRLVVRSSRLEPPANAVALDAQSWRSPPGSSNEDANKEEEENNNNNNNNANQSGMIGGGSGQTQIISDEYISSLVCPPPPNKSGAFLRADSTLLRQKSDMTSGGVKRTHSIRTMRLADEPMAKLESDQKFQSMIKAKSQHNIDSSLMGDNLVDSIGGPSDHNSFVISSNEKLLLSEPQQQQNVVDEKFANNLASLLVKKTEQLTRLLSKTLEPNDGATTPKQVADDDEEEEEKVMSNNGQDETKTEVEDTVHFDKVVETKSAPTSGENSNALERLRKSILELIETEFAFIRHLETIREHYMSPLKDMSFLNIDDLKHLSEIVSTLIEFQRNFFHKLALRIDSPSESSSSSSTVKTTTTTTKPSDEYEELNRVVQHLDSIQSLADFTSTLKSISQTFLDEAEKFKLYSVYCAAYSRLQKLLHPKRSLRIESNNVIASPNALDTFLMSNGGGLTQIGHNNGTNMGTGSGAGGSSRDFLKPLGSFISATTNPLQQNPVISNETKSQLKQLNEFLGQLDSSSSSVSLSLPKSSSSDSQRKSTNQSNNTNTSNKQELPPASTSGATFQKSAHQQSFESYLIKPIQRIVKYPMLLNSIALAAAQACASEELLIDIQRAVKHMGSITSHVNDTQRVHDEYGAIFESIGQQFLKQFAEAGSQKPVMGPHQPTIGLGIEQLLYLGQVDWLNILEFNPKMKRTTTSKLTHHLFVFNSCVVFICKEQVRGMMNSKKKVSNPMSSFNGHAQIPSMISGAGGSDSAEIIRYQSLIPVSEVQVRSAPPTAGQSQQQQLRSSRYKYQWELFRCSSVNSNSSLLTKTNKRSSTANFDGKVYLLASATSETRNLFLRKIRFIIRESVRNMSLPLTRSPSSKSLSPTKKLSSSSHTNNTSSSCSQSTSLSPIIQGGGGGGGAGKSSSSYIERDESNYNVTSIEVNN